MRAHRPAAVSLLAAAGLIAAGCGASASKKATPANNIASATAVASGATAPPPPNRKPDEASSEVIARVGNAAITRDLLEHWASVVLHGQSGAPEPPKYAACIQYLTSSGEASSTAAQIEATCKEKYGQVLRKALTLLIRGHWLIGAAAEEGVAVAGAKLKRATSPNGPKGEETRQTLATTGETIADVRFKFTLSQLSIQLHRKLEDQVPVDSTAQIADFYRHHKATFVVPERRDIYLVRLGTLGEAAQAKRKIERGASFATIVDGTTLMQPEEAHGGLIHGVEARDWPEPPLSREVFRAPIGKLEGPVQISLGYYIFRVVGKQAPYQRTFAQAKAEAAVELHLLRRERVFSRYVRAFTKRWAARTKCPAGDLRALCMQAKSPPTVAEEALNPG